MSLFAELRCEVRQAVQGNGELVREDPAFAVTVLLVEAADMVNEAEATHLGPDGFADAPAELILVRDRFERGEKLVLGPLEFHEDRDEYLPVVPVARKEDSGQFVQVLNAGQLVVADFDFRADHARSPRIPSFWKAGFLRFDSSFLEFQSLSRDRQSLFSKFRTEVRFNPADRDVGMDVDLVEKPLETPANALPGHAEPDRFLLGENRFSWTDLERIRFLREFLSSFSEAKRHQGCVSPVSNTASSDDAIQAAARKELEQLEERVSLHESW
jgi:hypothetical protein